jgi:Leucine-rich repeat (LRR) protein
LELRKTLIGDASLTAIAALPELQYLDIEECGITDAGLAQLVSATSLKTLVLTMNQGITDTSIEPLSRLTGLRELRINQTGISLGGVQKLASALPDCRIEHWSIKAAQ